MMHQAHARMIGVAAWPLAKSDPSAGGWREDSCVDQRQHGRHDAPQRSDEADSGAQGKFGGGSVFVHPGVGVRRAGID